MNSINGHVRIVHKYYRDLIEMSNSVKLKRLQWHFFVIFRHKCKNPHSLALPYNAGLLGRWGLHNLTEKQLFQLLLQNDPYLLPEVGHSGTSDKQRGDLRISWDVNL